MIHFQDGDIFTAPAEALVNPVNCDGIMGAGLARHFKERYPNNYKAYLYAYQRGNLAVGKVFSFKEGNLWIINFPTKDRWYDPSKLEYIDAGLDALIREIPRLGIKSEQEIPEQGIKSIAIPALGSGLGKLQWDEVKTLMVEKLQHVKNCEVLIYEPNRRW